MKAPAKHAADAAKVEIAVMIRSNAWRAALPNAARLVRRAAHAALDKASVSRRRRLAVRGGEIGVVLGTDAFIARLNRDFRGKAGPTNVLSFAVEPEADGTEGPLALGDVVIAFGTAKAEAKRAGKPLAHHLVHLTVHGVLHLLGYDHMKTREAARMEALETEILRGLGVPDPYRAAEAADVA